MSKWRYTSKDEDGEHANTWRAYHARQLVCEARENEVAEFVVAVDAYDHCTPISIICSPLGYIFERVTG